MTPPVPAARRVRRGLLVGAGLVALTGVAVHAQPRPEGVRPSTPGVIRREGTLLEARGRFEIEAGRLRFRPEEADRSLTVLENLSAERVEVHLRETPGATTWRVEGRLTEYQGANYLLIEYARRTL